MSLVRKFQQPSGPMEQSDALNNALIEELGTYNLKSKDEKKVREKLVELRDFLKQKGNAFSIDPLAGKYSISGAPNNFVGSPDEVQANWLTGKLKIKNPEDAMSVAAAIYGNAVKKINPTSSTPTRQDIGIKDIEDYAMNTAYGTPEIFAKDFYSIQSDDERKKIALEMMNKHVANYLSEADKNKDWANYNDVEKVKAFQSVLGTNDWDKIRKAAYDLKWDVGNFLVSDTQRASYKTQADEKAAEVQAQKAEESKQALTKDYDALVSKGFNPSVAQALVEQGYSKVVDTLPLHIGEKDYTSPFKTYLSNKNLHILVNPSTGQKRLINVSGENINQSGQDFDQFSPLSGIAWEHDTSGNLKFIPSQFKQQDFGNVGIELKGEVPGYPGWSITGWSGNEASSSSGRDYTKNIVLQNGNQKVTLTKGAGGYYLNGKLVPGVRLSGFGSKRYEINDLESLFPNLYKPTSIDQNYNYKNDLAILQNSLSTKEYGDSAKTAAANLINAILKREDIKNNDQLKKQILDTLAQFNMMIGATQVKKNGGILKAQAGAAFEEYKKKFKPAEPTTTTSTSPAKDISGTWKDMSSAEKTLRGASMAGVAGSFIPGYGAIGAGVTLLADIGADVVKDGFQPSDILNWNTAANLGFTALSFFGLGGIKALVKGAQTAKSVDVVGQTAAKAAKYSKELALTEAETKSLNKVVKLAERVNAKTPEQLAAKIEELKKITPKTKPEILAGHIKDFEEGLNVLNSIAVGATPVAGSLKLGKAAKAVATALPKSEKLAKYATTAAKAGFVGSGLMALPSIISTTSKEGIEYTRPEDWQRVLMGASVGSSWMKDIRGIKALQRQAVIETTGPGSTTFKLGNENVTLNQVIEKPKLHNERIPFSGAKSKNSAATEKFKNEVINAAKSEGKEITKEQLANLSLSDFTSKRGVTTTGFEVPAAPKATSRGRMQDVKDWELAKKYIDKYGIKFKTSNTKEFREPLPIRSTDKWRSLNEEKANIQKEIANAKKPINVKKLPGDIEQRKAWAATFKTTNKGVESTIAKKERILKSLENYRKLASRKPSKKSGGLIKKFATPDGELQLGSINPKSYERQPTVAGYLPFNPIPKAKANIFDEKGEYTPEFIKLRERITDDWAATNIPKVNDLLKRSGYTYQVKNADDWRRLVNDKKAGILHDLTYQLLTEPRTDVIPLTPKPAAPIATSTPELKPNVTSGGASIDTTKGILPELLDYAKKNIDPTALTNLVGYANTIATNRRAGDLQRQAVAQGLFNLPTLPYTYQRIDRRNAMEAEKLANTTRTRAGNIAKNVSDFNKGLATQLEGEAKANEFTTKGQQLDQERFDAITRSQLASNAAIDQYNNQVVGKNRELTAEAFGKIPLITSNQILANNAAFQNLLVAANKNRRIADYKNMIDKSLNDPNAKLLQQRMAEYEALTSGDEEAKYRKLYEDRKAQASSGNYYPTFEGSPEEKQFKNAAAAKYRDIQNLSDLVKQNYMRMQYYQPAMLAKKGATLNFKEKSELQALKQDYENKMKSIEQAYKAIMHNNEMLQKALIKVFK